MTLASDHDVRDYARQKMCELMRERGTTQVELAPVLGVVQVSVSKRVVGHVPLTLADIEKLARYWDVDPRAFLPTWESESAWTRLALAA